MKTSIILKGRVDNTGRQMLQIRISEKGIRRFVSTGIKIDPELWDEKAMKIKVSHPNHKDFNKRLEIARHQAEVVREVVKRPSEITLVQYCIESLSQWELEKKDTTLKALRSRLSNLKGFDKTVKLHQVNPAWLRSYQTYLKKKGQEPNTVWDNFKFLRTITLKALKEKVIGVDPFEGFTPPKYKDPKKVFLLEEQVQALEGLLNEPVLSAMERTVCTWFLIGCFTGLRFSDMQAFSRHWLRGDLLYLHTVKTASPVSIALPDKVLQLFKALDYHPLRIPNQLYNRIIKQLAKYAGITEPVSSHTARHTFATMALAKGVELPYVQEILGHSKIATTQVYAKIIAPKRNEQYRKLFE